MTVPRDAPAKRGRTLDPPSVGVARSAVALLVATVALLAIGIPVATTIAVGSAPYSLLHLGDPGPVVATATAATHAVADLAGVVSIGALLSITVLREGAGSRGLDVADSFESRVLRRAAPVWAGAAFLLVPLEAFDANGVTPVLLLLQPASVSGSSMSTADELGFLLAVTPQAQAWAVAFVGASAVVLASHLASRWTWFAASLGAGLIAALAPVVVGQILVGPEHDLGSDAGIIQTIATHLGLGLLLVAAMRAASGRLLRLGTAMRALRIAAATLALMVLAEPVLAAFKLQGPDASSSLTAGQILARSVALAILVVITAAVFLRGRAGRLDHRRLSTALIASALASAGWIGVSTAMTRFPPPQYFVPTSIPQNLLGFDVVDAPTAGVLLTQWRPNLLFLFLAVAAVALYLGAVARLRRRGDPWPFGRSLAWVLGWAVAATATSSGFGTYSGADFGVHMIVHMSLNMLAPLLLTLGGVVTLLLRASDASRGRVAGPHDWLGWLLQWRVLHVIYNPMLVFVLFVGSYYALYFTGLFEELVRYHWAHQLMNVHFLIVGYLYYGLAIGVDRPPRPLPHVGRLGFVLAAMPFHAFFGVILMTSAASSLVAENFYRTLALPWADLAASQYLAGGVAWSAGELPLMIVVIVLGVQWARQDDVSARRTDRHLDSGLNDEFDEYNRMLERLTARRGAPHPALGAITEPSASPRPLTAAPAHPAPTDPAPTDPAPNQERSQ